MIDVTKTVEPNKNVNPITFLDLKNKRTVNNMVCYFEYIMNLEMNNEVFIQQFEFTRMGEDVWELVTVLGDGENLGDTVMRLRYNIPTPNFELVKTCQMGLMYYLFAMQERMDYYNKINLQIYDLVPEAIDAE